MVYQFQKPINDTVDPEIFAAFNVCVFVIKTNFAPLMFAFYMNLYLLMPNTKVIFAP
jgi:hypothetical protein